MKLQKIYLILTLLAFLFTTNCSNVTSTSPTTTIIISSLSPTTETATPCPGGLALPSNPSGSNSVEIFLGASNKEKGLSLLPNKGDSYSSNLTRDCTSGRETIPDYYFYFNIDDSFYVDKPQPIILQVDYFDQGTDPIYLDYDAASQQDSNNISLVYKTVLLRYRQDTLTWQTVSFPITDAYFANHENFGSDFRLYSWNSPLIIAHVKLSLGEMFAISNNSSQSAISPAPYPKPLGQRTVFTYYFYWYDSVTLEHLRGLPFDPLTNKPPDFQTMTWRDVNWHRKQLEDMVYAGIDVLLPIYWYLPDTLWWSQPGVEVLAKALEQVRQEGITPPAVGMFLDTTSSKDKDLRLEDEQVNLYHNIHFFFTTIPRPYWALANGNHPIIWWYTADFTADYDQSFINYVYDHFQKDFGVRPYLAFDTSWDYPTATISGQIVKNTNSSALKYDASYFWGYGNPPYITPQVSSILPGYDGRLIPGRGPTAYIPRNNSNTYRNGFVQAMLCPAPWLAIETWDEYHEATEIAETLEYGRQYLDITREYTKYFKDGQLPAGIKIQTNYTNANEVSIKFGDQNQEAGLTLLPSSGDGQYRSINIDGQAANETVPINTDSPASYLYFQVDDGFYWNTPQKISVKVTYLDNGYEPIYIQYDSAKCGSQSSISQMYKQTLLGGRNNTKKWITATIVINDATFIGNQNYGADFRIATGHSPLTISEVEILKTH